MKKPWSQPKAPKSAQFHPIALMYAGFEVKQRSHFQENIPKGQYE